MKLETRIERIESFLGINNITSISTTIPSKLYNINNSLKFEKIKNFFTDYLDIDVSKYLIKSRVSFTIANKYLFLYTLITYGKLTFVEINELLELKYNFKYHRSNLYHVTDRHGDYMVDHTEISKYYKTKWKFIIENIEKYLTI